MADDIKDIKGSPLVTAEDKSELEAKSSQNLSLTMDSYADRGLRKLWKIANDPSDPWHNRYGFDALREIVRLTLPKRKETGGAAAASVEISLGDMFHSNSLPVDVTPKKRKRPRKLDKGNPEDTDIQQ